MHELQFKSWKRDSSIVLKNGDNIFKDTAKHSHDQNFVLKYLLKKQNKVILTNTEL